VAGCDPGVLGTKVPATVDRGPLCRTAERPSVAHMWDVTGHRESDGTSVFVVDDHDAVRRGLCELLAAADGIDVVGDAGDVDSAVRGIRATTPHVALLDVRLGERSGIEVCHLVRDDVPATRFAFLTSAEDPDVLFSAIDAGAAAFLLKRVRGADLVTTLRRVALGYAELDPAVTGLVLDEFRSVRRMNSGRGAPSLRGDAGPGSPTWPTGP